MGRSPGQRNGNPLQYSCLGNPMERGAWWATVYGVTMSRTRLKRLSMHTQAGMIYPPSQSSSATVSYRAPPGQRTRKRTWPDKQRQAVNKCLNCRKSAQVIFTTAWKAQTYYERHCSFKLLTDPTQILHPGQMPSHSCFNLV